MGLGFTLKSATLNLDPSRLGTGRDDRPGQANSLIFAIKLSRGNPHISTVEGKTWEDVCFEGIVDMGVSLN